MNTSGHGIEIQNAKDTFADIASIVAVVLIALVVLAIAQPRIRADLGTAWRHAGTQSHQVTHASATR
jgi:hypothetical protein